MPLKLRNGYLSAEKKAEIVRLMQTGEFSRRQVADKVGVSIATVVRLTPNTDDADNKFRVVPLNEQQRAKIYEWYKAGYSAASIAEELGVRKTQVRSFVNNKLRGLTTHMEQRKQNVTAEEKARVVDLFYKQNWKTAYISAELNIPFGTVSKIVQTNKPAEKPIQVQIAELPKPEPVPVKQTPIAPAPAADFSDDIKAQIIFCYEKRYWNTTAIAEELKLDKNQVVRFLKQHKAAKQAA